MEGANSNKEERGNSKELNKYQACAPKYNLIPDLGISSQIMGGKGILSHKLVVKPIKHISLTHIFARIILH